MEEHRIYNTLQQEKPMPKLKYPPEKTDAGEPLIEVRLKITRSQRKFIRIHQYVGDHADKHASVRDILQRYMEEHPQ